MNVDQMRVVIAEISFPDYEFHVLESHHGFIYLQAGYDEADTVTAVVEHQLTRRWPLNPEMGRSELVSTAFLCVLTSMEHRTREWFKYRGHAVYMPHYHVDALWAVCEAGANSERTKVDAGEAMVTIP